ncbi:uncharacterized protein LOC124607394 [Schistocerca americana]|uniref:uncharacterized protein LOC124607394 n=1 Tax=Schistocerca americana TaxID=7009 RepID=UPI001F4F7FBD|nr:uncharacterized protein LOC124607394 [Schistocerca americana]
MGTVESNREPAPTRHPGQADVVGVHPSRAVAGVGAGSGSSEAARGAGGVSAGWRNAMQPEAGRGVARSGLGALFRTSRRPYPDTRATCGAAGYPTPAPPSPALLIWPDDRETLLCVGYRVW